MGVALPELVREFEGNVLSVVILLVEFSLELVVDPLVLLGGGQEGQEAEGGEGSQEGQVGGPERPHERSKHIISVALFQSIYFKSNYPILKSRKTSKYIYQLIPPQAPPGCRPRTAPSLSPHRCPCMCLARSSYPCATTHRRNCHRSRSTSPFRTDFRLQISLRRNRCWQRCIGLSRVSCRCATPRCRHRQSPFGGCLCPPSCLWPKSPGNYHRCYTDIRLSPNVSHFSILPRISHDLRISCGLDLIYHHWPMNRYMFPLE